MAQVEFIYNGNRTLIQCNPTDKMKDITQKFLLKCDKKQDKIYFLYDGDTLKEELTFNELVNDLDKNRNQMSVIVNDNQNIDQDIPTLKKSKNIICPECNENIRISIVDYKISLYECKNRHKMENILFNDFEKTQNIDETKITCGNCKNVNKSSAFDNKFFICYSCKTNLCPICRSIHDKSHNIFDYDEKYYICNKHYDLYNSYCNNCKKDICLLCEKEHEGHKTLSYGGIIPDINSINKDLDDLKEKINEFKNNIKEIISQLNFLMENLDNYYKLYSDIVQNFDNKKRNYTIIQNINDMNTYNNNFKKNINKIINDKNLISKFNNIIEILDKMIIQKNNNGISKENNEKKYKFDSSNDKYENFDLDKIKELKSLKIEYLSYGFFVLHDGI